MSWLEARGEPRPEGYDVAQVCLNGHSVNSHSRTMPKFNRDHCDKCGAKTVTECPSCSHPIQGGYLDDLTLAEYEPPKFCHKCGEAFPWAEQRMKAAIELSIEVSGLTGDDAEQFAVTLKDLVRDTPRTQLAATRFQRLMGKAGQQTAKAVRDIVVDIVSETAKKMIWPDR